MIQDLTPSSCILIPETHGLAVDDWEPVEWLRDRIDAAYQDGQILALVTGEHLHQRRFIVVLWFALRLRCRSLSARSTSTSDLRPRWGFAATLLHLRRDQKERNDENNNCAGGACSRHVCE
jgi:hypothetical protein